MCAKVGGPIPARSRFSQQVGVPDAAGMGSRWAVPFLLAPAGRCVVGLAAIGCIKELNELSSHRSPASVAGSTSTPLLSTQWALCEVSVGDVGRVQCGVRVPCCPLWCLFVPSLGRLGCRDLGPGRCVLNREAGQPAGGDGQRQDKGLVVPSEKTQTWVSLRLKLPVPAAGFP